MKNHKIILISYIFVVFLFVLSPFIINCNIFLHPRITYAKLIATKSGKYNIDAIVVYSANGKVYTKEFSFDLLKKNQIRLIYNTKNPKEIIPLSISSLYLSMKMIFIDFLFIFISAVFFTIKQTHDVGVEDIDDK